MELSPFAHAVIQCKGRSDAHIEHMQYWSVYVRWRDTDRSPVMQVAARLGGPTVVQKGSQDAISDGAQTIYCTTEGSPRRAGGQVGCGFSMKACNVIAPGLVCCPSVRCILPELAHGAEQVAGVQESVQLLEVFCGFGGFD